MSILAQISVSGGVFVKVLCGLQYAFATVSPTFRKIFELSDTQVSVVGLCGNLGQYFGLLAGLCLARYGVKLTVLIGTVIGTVGYSLIWVATSEILPLDAANAIYFLCFVSFLGASSGPFFDTSTLVTNVHNFPEVNNLIIGFDKSFNGLGTSVWTSMYDGVFSVEDVYNTTVTRRGIQLNSRDQSMLDYLFAVPCIVLVVGTLGSLALHKVDQKVAISMKAIHFLYLLTFMIALYILGISIAKGTLVTDNKMKNTICVC